MQLLAQEGLLKGLNINLSEKEDWIIGRDPDQANFVLEDSSVSRKHVHIYKTDEGYFIKNLSSTNPTEVNDDVIDEYLLKENDRVRIGNTTFLFTTEEKKEIEEDFFEEEKEEEVIEEQPKEETIFEDIEEDLPFGLISEANYILKVISGPNAGAEFGMTKNKSYILGKDPNTCDIVFNDLSVSKQNAQVSIDDDGTIFIEDLKSKNGSFVNNIPIKDKTQITSQDLITVGTTTFLVIDRLAATDTIYSPAPSFEVKEEKEAEKEKTVWKKQFIPTKHLVMGSTVIVIIFFIFLSFFGLFRAKNIEIAKTDPMEKINNVLKNYKAMEFSYNPANQNLFLVGHVLTPVDKQELMYDIKALDFVRSTEDNIIIDEYVNKDINDTLGDNADFRSTLIISPEASKFVANGYVKNATYAENFKDFLNQNFPYLDKLENKVVIEEVLKAQIATMFLKNNLTSLTFDLISGELVLSGRYNKKQTSTFNELVDDLKTTPGIHAIKNLAIPTTAQSARIDISSKYKITGYAQYDNKNIGVVANGKIVTLGDLLDGMFITQITGNTILLEKDELKYKISYSR